MAPTERPAVVIFFNDWKVFPQGVNSGGGESATMALARQIARLGYRVIACAHLPFGECAHDGIEFWNFGGDYALHRVEQRLRDIGPYHCLCATLAHPLLVIREHKNCLSRIIINHSPSPHASGLEPTTVLELVDYMACVSTWQKGLIEGVIGGETNKLLVVKNGFDPELFQYAGPEGRDWNQLIFIGRVEPAKGIHVLVQIFGQLKAAFPDLKLAVYGDDQRWTEFANKKEELVRRFPGLVFHGKVPQRELSVQLRRAGLLVFPSIGFESAGLAVVDAQASGCPVIALDSGGVVDYLNPHLGDLVTDKSVEALREGIARMLRNRARLEEISRRAETIGRERTWAVVAKEIMGYAEKAAAKNGAADDALPEIIQRVEQAPYFPAEMILRDHENLGFPDTFPESELEQRESVETQAAWPHLVRGLRLETAGSVVEAIAAYHKAAHRCAPNDWQPFFRLALLHADRRELAEASRYARTVLERAPQFPLRRHLEKLIQLAPAPTEPSLSGNGAPHQ